MDSGGPQAETGGPEAETGGPEAETGGPELSMRPAPVGRVTRPIDLFRVPQGHFRAAVQEVADNFHTLHEGMVHVPDFVSPGAETTA